MKTLFQCSINTLEIRCIGMLNDRNGTFFIGNIHACRFFYVGKWMGKKEKIEDIMTHTLDTLEKNNMIKVKKEKWIIKRFCLLTNTMNFDSIRSNE